VRFKFNHPAPSTILAFLARFGILAAFWPSWSWHQKVITDQWNEFAVNLVDHGTFAFARFPESPTVMRGPLFPLMEVPLYLIFGENYALWVISLLLFDLITCCLLIAGTRIIWEPRPSLLAGLLYAVSLPIIYYTCKIMQVTSIMPLVVLWLCLVTFWERNYFCRWVPWVTGIVSGLMILSKSAYLPIPLLSVALLLWLNRSRIRKLVHAAPVALYLLTTVVVVAPWTCRNYVVSKGHSVPVQSMFWELFVQDVFTYDLDTTMGHDRPEGQHQAYCMAKWDAILEAAGISVTQPPGARAEWEIQREAAFREAALQMIRDEPLKVLAAKLTNVWQYWVLAENWRKTRLFILLQIVPIGAAVVGLVSLWRYRQLEQIKFGLMLIVVLWGEHCLVWGWGRLSLDLMPVLAIIFGLGMHMLASRLTNTQNALWPERQSGMRCIDRTRSP